MREITAVYLCVGFVTNFSQCFRSEGRNRSWGMFEDLSVEIQTRQLFASYNDFNEYLCILLALLIFFLGSSWSSRDWWWTWYPWPAWWPWSSRASYPPRTRWTKQGTFYTCVSRKWSECWARSTGYKDASMNMECCAYSSCLPVMRDSS